MLQTKEKIAPLWLWIFIPITLGIGWTVVYLGHLGSTRQLLIVLTLILISLTSWIYLVKPYIVVNSFIFVIPLLIGQEIVAGLNAGELATLFITSLGIVTLLTLRRKIVESYRQLQSLIWPLLGLALIGLISALVNSAVSFAEIIASVFKPLTFAIVTFLVFIHNDSRKKIQGLIKALLLGGLAVASYSILAYFMGWSYYPQYGYNRAAGTFEHWNQLGGYMVLISVPTLAYSLSTKHFWSKFFFLLAFLAEIVALLLSLTLGSILSLLLSGLIAIFIIFKLSPMRILGYFLLIALAFLSAWLTNPALEIRLSEETIHNRLLDRLATYTVGLRLVQAHFWFGLGSQDKVLEAVLYSPAGYRYTPFGEISSVPHNAFLSVWAEKGIFGLLLFIIIIVNCLKMLLHRLSARESRYYLLYQGVVIGLLGFLIQNMTNNLLLHPRIGFIFFALVVAAVRIKSWTK